MKPLTRLLVPLDGSDVSLWVLDRALRLLQVPRVEATLLSVVETTEELASDVAYRLQPTHRPVEDRLAGIRRGLEERGILAEAEVRFGDPATEILREIEKGKHDLVVMATHGRRGLDRLMFGSVAAKVLRASPVPLVLFRPLQRPDETLSPAETAEPARFRRILVPLDGSQAAEEIAPAAETLARTFGSKLYLFRAIPGGPGEEAERLAAVEYLGNAARAYRDAGFMAEFLVRTGLPAEEALDVLRELSIDAVAMTTHGYTGLARALHGSVAERILVGGGVPVVLLRNRRLRTAMPAPAHPSRWMRVR